MTKTAALKRLEMIVARIAEKGEIFRVDGFATRSVEISRSRFVSPPRFMDPERVLGDDDRNKIEVHYYVGAFPVEGDDPEDPVEDYFFVGCGSGDSWAAALLDWIKNEAMTTKEVKGGRYVPLYSPEILAFLREEAAKIRDKEKGRG